MLRAIRLTPDDFPITVALAEQLGFPVTNDMPRVVRDLMDLCPQPTSCSVVCGVRAGAQSRDAAAVG